jgi:hypothetical protein
MIHHKANFNRYDVRKWTYAATSSKIHVKKRNSLLYFIQRLQNQWSPKELRSFKIIGLDTEYLCHHLTQTGY